VCSAPGVLCPVGPSSDRARVLTPTLVTPSNRRHSPSRPYTHISEHPGYSGLPDDDDRGSGGDRSDDPNLEDIPAPPSVLTPKTINDEARATKSFIESIARLAESVNSDKKESTQTKLREPI
jgi:hypothetical protein